ncbi:PP2C family serine/threonine-protein phosphatase [Vibrio splendidus]
MQDILTKRLNRPVNGNRSSVVHEVGATLATTVGLIRTENEDRAISARFYSSKMDRYVYFYILSDGMGGMVNGGLAATNTVSTFLSSIIPLIESGIEIEQAIQQSVLAAHQIVSESTNGKGGATLSAIVSHEAGAFFTVNVGDSRIYQCTTNNSIFQITEDDDVKSFLEKLNGIELNSLITKRNGLTKYIGMEGELEVNVESCSALCDLLVISDGISLIGEANLVSLYENKTTDSEFVQRCIHLSNWLGGHDNATAIYASIANLTYHPETTEVSHNCLEVWDCHGYIIIPLAQLPSKDSHPKEKTKKVRKKAASKKTIKNDKDDSRNNQNLEINQESLFSSDDTDEISPNNNVFDEGAGLDLAKIEDNKNNLDN